jgi:hypothetical protein
MQYEPPYHIETDELGIGWDWAYSTSDITEAFRLASEITKSWQMRGDEGKVRITDRNGNEF